MLIRARSKDGNFRFQLEPSDSAEVLAQKIIEITQNADPNTITISDKPRGGEIPLSTLKGRKVGGLGLKHGDLLFVSYESNAADSAPSAPSTDAISISNPSATGTAKRPWELVQEDPVDTYWRSRDGKIPRGRDPHFCKHGANAMCDYCMPLEPYDPTYHASQNIKHLSYHSYLRKLQPTGKTLASSSTQFLPPLDPLSYKVKIPCPSGSHPSYPAGICSKCQPSAITLQPQPFRMVDHLEFSSPSIIDSFLQTWRHTGFQRFGWLIGRYAPYEEVPMGIKAVVEAIHEPPQEGDLDGLSLELPWGDEARIKSLAAAAGLSVVGMIWTDLTPDSEDKSKSICKRHQDSYFLSSVETIFAAKVQLDNPTPSKSSSTGVFSSRMVTAVLSGTPEGGIDVSAYMVSEQAVAMVDADMIEASVEPGTVRVKEEEEGRYVPDVFFRFKNEYGIDVKQSAKPCFPVEYLLVNVTHGFPTTPSPSFISTTQFAIENRPGIEHQDVTNVMATLYQLKAPELMAGQDGGQRRKDLVTYLSDWHLLAFLGSVGILSEDDTKALAKVVTAPNLDDPHILDSAIQTDGWQTLMAITEDSAPRRPNRAAPQQPAPGTSDADIPPELFDAIDIPPDTGFGSSGGAGGSGVKVCPHCTFENPSSNVDCEVCGLPLSG
ncbi:nuclear protein localization protein 4 [Tulasnella sp. 419]|nr:nuclear protein localization protein 4 [Tulasnella sp. 419]